MTSTTYIVEESAFSHFLLASTASSFFWLLVRLYVGWTWLLDGWEKLHDPMWTGSSAGQALIGFINGALTKTGGVHPDVQSWYATFLRLVVLTHPVFWANLVTWSELLVGVALIIGLFAGIAAFFGLFMNLSSLLAGTVSINPILFVASIGLILAWRVAGYIGADYFVLPALHRHFRPVVLIDIREEIVIPEVPIS